MTTREFEKAQLRLDIDQIRDRYVIMEEVEPEDVVALRQVLQDYFERRD